MPYVEVAIVVDAPARDVYELAKEQERFPQFMPDVESVTVVERHPDRILTKWKTLVEDAPIEWIEEDRFDDAAIRIEYALLEGDLDTFEGAWTLEKKVRENTEMMLAGLKAEAEARVSSGRR